MQKKCYKILDSILNSGKPNSKVLNKLNQNVNTEFFKQQNEAISLFIEQKFQLITATFSTALAKCNSAAKVPRLKCLLDLMDYVNLPAQKLFLRQILPEVILCIKEINQKSRDASFQLLNSMLKVWQNLGLAADEPITEIGKLKKYYYLKNLAFVKFLLFEDSLYEFFRLVMIGLAGSANMISCTCLALSSLAHEYRGKLLFFKFNSKIL